MGKEKTIILGELFCGPGGMALGATSSEVTYTDTVYKIKHGWASDYDPDACSTYKHNICPESPETVICKDVRNLDIRSLPDINAFAFGFPCNDFSVVGEQLGFDGKFGPLYAYGISVINHFKPVFFVAENVSGIKSANNGNALKKIITDLRHSGNGYELTIHLYKAEEYGIPQTRHRLIIVGIDQSLKLKFKVPRPEYVNKYVTAREALEIPPIPENALNNEFTKQSENVIKRLAYIKPGENAWNAEIPYNLKLNVKTAKMSQIYRRLHPDKPSYTITGSGGGGTHVYHWKEARALTNRERARIQTFPDKFVFHGSKESVRKQIGMAVPPKLSEIIFSSILKTFAGINYQSITPNYKEEVEIPEINKS